MACVPVNGTLIATSILVKVLETTIYFLKKEKANRNKEIIEYSFILKKKYSDKDNLLHVPIKSLQNLKHVTFLLQSLNLHRLIYTRIFLHLQGSNPQFLTFSEQKNPQFFYII